VKLDRTAIVVWCLWTAASTLGLLLGVWVFFRLIQPPRVPVPGGPWSDSVNLAALGGGAGALLGLCQGLVLARRLRLHGTLGWIVATAAGGAFALAVLRGGDGALRLLGAGVFFDALTSEIRQLAWLVVLGTAVGLAQWLVLRQRVAAAAWWIPGSAVATLAPFYGVFYGLAVLPREVVARTWPWLAFALFGALTGAVLVTLLRRDPGPGLTCGPAESG
jgi:hypothetical protein